jgi:hypothetical protein
MQPNGTVTYVPREDAGPKSELLALVNAYKYVLDCHSKREATCPGSPDDAKGSKSDRARPIIQESK